MKTTLVKATSIRGRLADEPFRADLFLWGRGVDVPVGDLLRGTTLGGRLAELEGRSVLLLTREPLAAATALIELDGVAARLVVCPPGLSNADLKLVIARAGVDAIVSDCGPSDDLDCRDLLQVICGGPIAPSPAQRFGARTTEWILLTSGTTGSPRMSAHTLPGLAAALDASQAQTAGLVWGTFYDIRRYGGLQIFLRAVLGGGSLVVTGAGELQDDFLIRLAAHGATHVSGTPSHWRRALMSPASRAVPARYVRLSGEIADQAILNALASQYPDAAICHAFASTEAGVGFEVNDGRAGFPASYVGADGDVQIRIENDSLHLRSRRVASHYVGESSALAGADGFVDTGDLVERRGDRYYFLGRRSGVINIGGLKVCPEEVEAAINHHPEVQGSLVTAKSNPIVGALVAARVVLRGGVEDGDDRSDVKNEILAICKARLAAHKVPATIHFVRALDMSAAGKLDRHHA